MSCHTVWSQNTFSPYTVFGIGDLNNRSMTHNMAMGEIGIGTPSVWNINNMNPALLTYNTLSIFELSIQGENRTMADNVDEQKAGSAGYKNLSFAFPVMPGKWTTNFGITPMSTINYNFFSTVPIKTPDGTTLPDESAQLDSKGQGGLTEVNFSNGFRIYKGLSLGVRASFVFGFSEHVNTSSLGGTSQQFPTTVTEKTNYSGFTYGFGLAYGTQLKDSDNSLSFGLIYDVAKDLEGSRLTEFSVNTSTGGTIIGDTLQDRSYDDAFNLPSKLGIGISWTKDNFIKLGIDVTQSNWQSDAGFGQDREEYRAAYSAGIGFEIIPNYDDVDSYISRIRYRVGFRYEELPYLVNGQKVNDIGINFGWALPIRGVSTLNMSCKIGKRGSTDNSLIEENYFKFALGATINDRWFVRRKYN